MKRFLKIEGIFISQHLKRLMEYKLDFMIGAIGFFIAQLLQLFLLTIIFSQIPKLQGWTFEEILFIYGFSLIPKGIDHLFFDNLWMVGYRIVRKGEFDKYLTRPINSLFHVLCERFQLDAFGELITGTALIIYASIRINFVFHWHTIPFAVIAVIFAVLIYLGIKIITSAISFWTKTSGHVTHMIYMTNEFSKYPVTIYNKIVQGLITYVIPFAFTAYYPAHFIMTGENPLFNIGGTVIAGTLLFSIGLFVWGKGLKAYESAGS